MKTYEVSGILIVILISLILLKFVNIIVGITFFIIGIGLVLWISKKNTKYKDKKQQEILQQKKQETYTKQQKRHDSLFSHLPNTSEVPERLAVYDHLDKKDVVLEIGGNIGGVSAVIATLLENPKNLVVIEPSKSAVEELIKLKTFIKKDFNIFNGILTIKNQRINCSQPNKGGYSECKPVSNSETLTILNKTFYEIQAMYNLIFDTLVIDCEGCYESIFKDSIESGWLNQICKIIIEWDGEYMEKLLLDNGFKLIDYKEHSVIANGVKTYVKERPSIEKYQTIR